MTKRPKPRINLDQAIRRLSKPSKRVTAAKIADPDAKRRKAAKAARASRKRNRQ